MQTLDYVSGLRNCLEFSQPLSCLYQAMQTQEKSFPVGVLEYTSFSRLVKANIRILQTFLCFFFHWDLFIYFFNLLNFYPVTRFLVTLLLVTRCCVNLFSKRRQETVSMPTIIAKISNNTIISGFQLMQKYNHLALLRLQIA